MSMEDLPNELVIMITDLLNTKDIVNGSLFWRSFDKIGVAAVSSRLTRLYVHPTRLKEVIDVCNHKELSRYIIEVVIVGKDRPWRPCSMEDLEPLPHTRPYVEQHPWPAMSLLDPFSIPNRGQKARKGHREQFTEKYDALIQALRNLKKLDTIGYCSTLSVPGLCSVTSDTIEQYADRIPDTRTTTKKSYWLHWLPLRWSDAKIFFGIMMSRPNTFTNLRFEDPLMVRFVIREKLLLDKAQEAALIPSGYNLPYEAMADTLMQFTLAIPGTRIFGIVQALMDGMTALQSLTLLYTPLNMDATRQPAYLERITLDEENNQYFLDQILNHDATAKNLSRLEVRAVSPDGFPLPIWGSRGFLERHKKTLNSLKITNLFIGRHDQPWQPHIKEGTQRLLKYIKTDLSLEAAEVNVSCSYDDSILPRDYREPVFMASLDLEVLAKELYLELDEDERVDLAKRRIEDLGAVTGGEF